MSGLLNRVGIGGPDVSVSVPRGEVVPGQSVDVRVDVEGGSSSTEADGVYVVVASAKEMDSSVDSGGAPLSTTLLLKAVTKVTGKGDDPDPLMEVVSGCEWLADRITIGSGEHRTMSTTFQVPVRTPLTRGDTVVWIGAGLDVSMSRDPSDRQYIDVLPDRRFDALFEAAEAMGLRFRDARLTAAGNVYTKDSPLAHDDGSYQEFEYEAVDGPYADQLDTVTFRPDPSPEGMTVDVVLDTGGRLGIGGDDARETVRVDHDDAGTLRGDIEATIDRSL